MMSTIVLAFLLSGTRCCSASEPTKNEINLQDWERQVAIAELLTKSIGESFGIVATTLTILTYLIFPTLRTTFGQNLISLSFSILIGNTLELLSNVIVINGACKIIEIFLYWSSLSQTLWSTMIMIDLMMAFRSKDKKLRQNKYRFCIYSCIVWTMSTMTTTALILLAVFLPGMLEDVKSRHCWIGSFYGQLVAYVLPISLFALLNIVLFCLVRSMAYYASVVSNARRTLLQKTKRRSAIARPMDDTCKAMMNIVIVLGLTEVFGLIKIGRTTEAAIIVNAVFSYIYVFFHSFRGLLIFVCLTSTRRIAKLYRERFLLNKTNDCLE